jgi:uncharacterized membrane protein YjjP (DUF1212 family)
LRFVLRIVFFVSPIFVSNCAVSCSLTLLIDGDVVALVDGVGIALGVADVVDGGDVVVDALGVGVALVVLGS